VEPRRLLHSRSSGSISGGPQAGLHHMQTTVYRLESKKAVRCVKRISNANIFEAAISRGEAQGKLIDELLGLFGGRTKPVMAHLIESGQLTLDDVKEAEQALKKLARKDKSK
jgi:BlaI family penicillinase repressor